MHTKLTLRMDADLIQQAKQYAKQHHKSLSEMVADHFAQLKARYRTQAEDPALSPIVRSLKGLLRDAKQTRKQDYHLYLEDKYL